MKKKKENKRYKNQSSNRSMIYEYVVKFSNLPKMKTASSFAVFQTFHFKNLGREEIHTPNHFLHSEILNVCETTVFSVRGYLPTFFLVFAVLPGSVHRRNGVTVAQRGTPYRHDEHEIGTGAQVSCRAGSQVGKLRSVHALRPLSRCSVTRSRPAQPQPGESVVGSVLRRSTSSERSSPKSVH